MRKKSFTWYDGEQLQIEGKGWRNTSSLYERLPKTTTKAMLTEDVWSFKKHTAGFHFRF